MRSGLGQVRFFHRPRIIWNERIDADNGMAGAQQALAQVGADESRGPRNQTFHERPSLGETSLDSEMSDSRRSSRLSSSSIRRTVWRTRLLNLAIAAERSVSAGGESSITARSRVAVHSASSCSAANIDRL